MNTSFSYIGLILVACYAFLLLTQLLNSTAADRLEPLTSSAVNRPEIVSKLIWVVLELPRHLTLILIDNLWTFLLLVIAFTAWWTGALYLYALMLIDRYAS